MKKPKMPMFGTHKKSEVVPVTNLQVLIRIALKKAFLAGADAARSMVGYGGDLEEAAQKYVDDTAPDTSKKKKQS